MRAVLCWGQFHCIPYKHSESRILLLMLLLLSHGILQRHRHLFPRQFSPLAIKRESDPQCTHSFAENPIQTSLLSSRSSSNNDIVKLTVIPHSITIIIHQKTRVPCASEVEFPLL